ncbi:MAG TPA: trehalose-6-phosphate synthase [Candidatus Dormibacteraeota bacterium]
MDSLREYTGRVLEPWSPVVVSNRAPFEPGPGGRLRRGAGGLVTALLTVAEATRADWIACARTPAERELAEAGHGVEVAGYGDGMRVHYVKVDPERYRRYYSVIANPLIWFIQHYLWDLRREPVIDERIWDAWYGGYVAVNRAFGDRVAEVAQALPRKPLILTQDYQLYLAPTRIRELLPQATLQQFIHIPWPTPQYWRVLPQPMRDAIMHGLLANDVIGFQSLGDVRRFLISCEELIDLRVDHRERAVLYNGRVVWARSYPISIDVGSMERLAQSPAVRTELEALRAWRPEKLIVRVDRTDPAKNIVRGFLAYERMLRAHPELWRRVVFYAFLQPSRQDISAYRDYVASVKATAERINRDLGQRGGGGWQPIRLEFGENLRRAVAAYLDFDVLLINPIYDGMNLVAKEGMLLNRRHGVLVLSENAGAHEELGAWAQTINPFDVDATGEALHHALTLPESTRRRSINAIREQIRTHDLARWLSLQVRDLRDLVMDEGQPSPQPAG